jgi:hypothetical protein
VTAAVGEVVRAARTAARAAAAEAAIRLLDTMPATATKTQVVVAATDFAEHMRRIQGCGRAAPADDPEVTGLLARARVRETQD